MLSKCIYTRSLVVKSSRRIRGGGIPTVATDYSPLWDLNAGEWTKEAIDKGYRSRLIEEFQILGFVERHWITGPGGGKFGSTGFIINCPIVERLN